MSNRERKNPASRNEKETDKKTKTDLESPGRRFLEELRAFPQVVKHVPAGLPHVGWHPAVQGLCDVVHL